MPDDSRRYDLLSYKERRFIVGTTGRALHLNAVRGDGIGIQAEDKAANPERSDSAESPRLSLGLNFAVRNGNLLPSSRAARAATNQLA